MKFPSILLLVTLLFQVACTSSVKKESISSDSLTSSLIDDSISTVEEEPGEAINRLAQEGVQEKWNYKFFGFSKDLSLTAFETSGYDDMNWIGYEYYLVKVDKNDFASKPYRERFEENQLPDSVRTVVNDWLSKSNLPGASTKFGLNGKQYGKITIRGKQYELKLLEKEAGENKMFELQLTDPSTFQTWILQRDKKLPSSRGDVKAYYLRDAYVKDGKLAVILDFDLGATPDYENQLHYVTKQMMVTGSVDSKPNRSPVTVTGTLQYAGLGDCYHIEFSCGDFGNAERKLSAEEEELWKDLTVDNNDETSVNPKYNGVKFQITYVMTEGTPCGDPSDPNPPTEVELIIGFKKI